MPFDDAVGKFEGNSGQWIVMLDALEQAASSPLYNVYLILLIHS